MIDPRGMDARDWFDAVVLDLGTSWAFGRFDGNDWQAYAVGFVRAPPLAQHNLPDPYQFDRWDRWAERAAILMEHR